MRILIVSKSIIPVFAYGGIERVVWGLAKSLAELGHQVTFLAKKGSYCDFAKVIDIDETMPIMNQIGDSYDVVHFNFRHEHIETCKLPYVVTKHGNANNFIELDQNTVFISKDHAARYGSDCYVYNGLDWSGYLKPDLNAKRSYFHFLGNAAWRVKNVAGAIDVIKKTKSEKLKVLGGVRFNFKMGMRFTFTPKVQFEGMVGGEKKSRLLNGSKGLIFPVRWSEPFGLAIIESLYYGCPVFGTPYGALPEIVKEDVGFLSNKQTELREAVLNVNKFSNKRCYEYANDEFNSKQMALGYLKKYEKVMSGAYLHTQPPKLLKLQEEKFLEWS